MEYFFRIFSLYQFKYYYHFFIFIKYLINHQCLVLILISISISIIFCEMISLFPICTRISQKNVHNSLIICHLFSISIFKNENEKFRIHDIDQIVCRVVQCNAHPRKHGGTQVVWDKVTSDLILHGCFHNNDTNYRCCRKIHVS